ncbi:MAG: MTH1187 family thiamine-binding protein [Candidatus Dadabacteria bacterium]|nr:MTH1187 family thiamine-binding protein [Candidatus Dadabacteria bacterium]
MIVELSVIPIGVGTSLSEYIAEVTKIIQESSLKYKPHSMGTNFEGEWDEIMPLIKRCHEGLYQKGVLRISTILRISDRRDKPYTMEGKIESFERKLR